MEQNSLIDSVIAKPDILRLAKEQSGLGWDENKLRDKLAQFVPSIVQEVITAYEWDFAVKESSTTSVADTYDYRLEGENKDCLEVISVTFDDGDYPLTKRSKSWIRDHLRRNTISDVLYWVRWKSQREFPVIRLFDTPTAGKTIAYEYWDSYISIGMLPAYLDYTLECALARRLIPAYGAPYQLALSEAIAAYERPMGDTDPTVLDRETRQRNQTRGGLYGW